MGGMILLIILPDLKMGAVFTDKAWEEQDGSLMIGGWLGSGKTLVI